MTVVLLTNTKLFSEVLFATACQTYLYSANSYAHRGKLGVAVTGLKTVIIYGQKQKLLSTCKVEPQTKFSVTAANFLTFYDDANQCWGVMFGSEKDLETFQLNIALVKVTLSDMPIKEQGNFVQSDSKVVAQTDKLRVSCDGYVINDEKLGAQFDSEDSLKITLNSPELSRKWLNLLIGSSETGL